MILGSTHIKNFTFQIYETIQHIHIYILDMEANGVKQEVLNKAVPQTIKRLVFVR